MCVARAAVRARLFSVGVSSAAAASSSHRAFVTADPGL